MLHKTYCNYVYKYFISTTHMNLYLLYLMYYTYIGGFELVLLLWIPSINHHTKNLMDFDILSSYRL